MFDGGDAPAAEMVFDFEESQTLQLRTQWEDIMVGNRRIYDKVVVLLLYWIRMGASYLDSKGEVGRHTVSVLSF